MDVALKEGKKIRDAKDGRKTGLSVWRLDSGADGGDGLAAKSAKDKRELIRWWTRPRRANNKRRGEFCQ